MAGNGVIYSKYELLIPDCGGDQVDFFQVIEKRRSIRRYKNQPIEPEIMKKIVEAALRAPSSRNLQPCEFIVVTDHRLLGEMAKAKEHGASFLAEAPLALVVCADPEKSDVWIEDASIASAFIFLAAEALGLGSCWIQIRERRHKTGKPAEEVLRDILHLPSHLKVLSIIAMGYPDEEKTGHSKEELQFDNVYRVRCLDDGAANYRIRYQLQREYSESEPEKLSSGTKTP